MSTVTLAGGAGTATVHYTTSDLSAVAGTDYTATSGTLKFLPGQTTNSIDVPILGGVGDADNTYLLTLSAPTGASLGGPPAQAVTFFVANPVSLAGPSAQSNYDGDTVSLPLTASDALGNPLSFSATNLPAGLSIDGSTGIISGAIASNADAGGPYTVTVSATDIATGVSASQSFSWTVYADPVAADATLSVEQGMDIPSISLNQYVSGGY